MDVHCAVVSHVFIAPDQVEQVLTAVYPARIAEEKLHQVEFLGGEVDRGPVLPGGPFVAVENDMPLGEAAGALSPLRAPRPAENGPDTAF